MRIRDIYAPLRRRADFSRVHQQGRRKSDAVLQVRLAPRPADVPSDARIRLGILVTKKYGSAVERNRFKRLVRAAIRALGPDLTSGWDLLVLPRAAHDATMPVVLASLRSLLGMLGAVRAPALPEAGPS
jgi:ribonuclease P protein component